MKKRKTTITEKLTYYTNKLESIIEEIGGIDINYEIRLGKETGDDVSHLIRLRNKLYYYDKLHLQYLELFNSLSSVDKCKELNKILTK